MLSFERVDAAPSGNAHPENSRVFNHRNSYVGTRDTLADFVNNYGKKKIEVEGEHEEENTRWEETGDFVGDLLHHSQDLIGDLFHEYLVGTLKTTEQFHYTADYRSLFGRMMRDTFGDGYMDKLSPAVVERFWQLARTMLLDPKYEHNVIS
jgi:hypothetical protein